MNTWSKSQLKNLWQHASTIPAPSQGYSIFEKSNRLIFIESRYSLQHTIRYRILFRPIVTNRSQSKVIDYSPSVSREFTPLRVATATLSTPHLPTLYLMLYSSSLPHLSQRNDSVVLHTHFFSILPEENLRKTRNFTKNKFSYWKQNFPSPINWMHATSDDIRFIGSFPFSLFSGWSK